MLFDFFLDVAELLLVLDPTVKVMVACIVVFNFTRGAGLGLHALGILVVLMPWIGATTFAAEFVAQGAIWSEWAYSAFYMTICAILTGTFFTTALLSIFGLKGGELLASFIGGVFGGIVYDVVKASVAFVFESIRKALQSFVAMFREIFSFMRK